jgi:hypothetical protein
MVRLTALLALIVAAGSFSFGRRLARSIARGIGWCSVALDSFDTAVIDGIVVNGVGRLARLLSRISALSEAWVLDGPVNVGARVIWALSFPVRMFQTGLLQSYLLLAVLGLIGFLGYSLYVAHHAIR